MYMSDIFWCLVVATALAIVHMLYNMVKITKLENELARLQQEQAEQEQDAYEKYCQEYDRSQETGQYFADPRD